MQNDVLWEYFAPVELRNGEVGLANSSNRLGDNKHTV